MHVNFCVLEFSVLDTYPSNHMGPILTLQKQQVFFYSSIGQFCNKITLQVTK